MIKKFFYILVSLSLIFPVLNSCSGSYNQLTDQHKELKNKPAVFPDSIINKIEPGLHVPSITPGGTYFKMLIIFVQFPDDNWNPKYAEWPKGKTPSYKNKIVDSSLYENNDQENVSEYFREMSLGKFHVIGNTLNTVTPHSRKWYLENHKRRDFINKDVLKEIDSTVDFKQYDNWTNLGENKNKFQPDNKVDMIWMIYRNIAQDLDNPGKTAAQLGFGIQSGINKYDKWSGEASLGYGSSLYVDDSTRIININYFDGSGITIMEGYSGYRKVKNLCIHEFGHHLIGNTSMHTGLGFWGMMSGAGSRSPCANSFERNRLGWTKPIEIKKDTVVDVTLGDYITTGENIKIYLPGSGGEYYYLENHQCILPFDVPVKNVDSKGLYLLHQTGPTNSDIRLISAAGRWNWKVTSYTKSPWGPQMLPVFIRETPDAVNGYFENEVIPYKDSSSRQSSSLIFIYVDPYTGKEIIHPFCDGWGFDAFNKNYCDVFSEWSNPRALNRFNKPVHAAFQIISEDSSKITVRIFTGKENVKEAAPSKVLNLTVEKDFSGHPLLKWPVNINPAVHGYCVYRSNGYGKFNEINVLPAPLTNFNNISGDENNIMRWQDNSIILNSSPSKILYKIAAMDSSGHKSVLSDNALEKFP